MRFFIGILIFTLGLTGIDASADSDYEELNEIGQMLNKLQVRFI
jgi:hypothetical protein